MLTRVRADYAHDFRAPVVVCPECTFAAVRRRHPITAEIRLSWRRICAVYGLAWRAAIAIILALGTAILTYRISDELEGAGVGPLDLAWQLLGIRPRDGAWDYLTESGGRVTLIIGACWTALAGAVLAGGLAHLRRRWISWLLFAPLVMLFIWTPALVSNWERLERGETSGFWVGGLSYNLEAAFASTVFLSLTPIMLLGAPLGAIARHAILRRDVRRFARKRTFIRARKAVS